MAPSEGTAPLSARPSQVIPVPLASLVGQLGLSAMAADDVLLTGVSLNSATVVAGDLYAALPGARTHGARFAAAAIEAGAAAILSDGEGAQLIGAVDVPVVVADDPRALLGAASAFVYGSPAASLYLVGVTGTQGKTTTTQLIAAGAARAGQRTAVVGTMGTWVDGQPVGSALTTPEAPDLHALFAVMRERGVGLCAIEVSSHALVMGRVDGVVFDLAVFTNLGRDHLDFHSDIEDYFNAKAQLFTAARSRRALVNIDDPYGKRLAASPEVATETFSTAGAAADWAATIDLENSTAEASAFAVSGPDGLALQGTVAMAGLFNVANALCAVAACRAGGVDPKRALDGIAVLGPVAGRMERVAVGQDFTVIVDYAHKPDAVEAALAAIRPVTPGRVMVVIGAGGDRDRGKRPIMGGIAARLADVVVVTDDNPRSEDAGQIRREVLDGAREAATTASIVEIGDRRAAIDYAIAAAVAGDTVLIAGKGHETGQEIAGSKYPFDDREVALASLAARTAEAAR